MKPSRRTRRTAAAYAAPGLALGAFALATATAARPAAAQTQVIKLATLVPEGSVWDKSMREMGADWAASTQNRVTLRVYPGGVAGDEPDLVRKMRIGQLQAAAVTTAGLANIDPAFNVFNIPMFFTSYPELYATLAKLEPLLRQRLDEKGFVLLSWGHGGWVYFFTKTPVSSVEGLRKTKMFVWAGDDKMVALWKSQGFQPVPLAATDIMSAPADGHDRLLPDHAAARADAAVVPPDAEHGRAWALAPLVGGLVMTKTAWAKIAPADQKRIMAGCAQAAAPPRGRGAAPGHHRGDGDAEARPQGEPGRRRQRRRSSAPRPSSSPAA